MLMVRTKRSSFWITGLVALIASGFAYWLKLRPWYNRWGATDAELAQALPGDEIVRRLRTQSTRAITIAAPMSAVWPWLVQLGQGRGGLYSYDWAENLVGCDIHSADQIIPELLDLKVGDVIRLGPPGYPSFPVADIIPGRALVLGDVDPKLGAHSWTFYLQPIDEQTTRLIVRSRGDYPSTLSNFLIWQIITEPLHFVMERKMLQGIKWRAEKALEHHA
jgi:hypothetical protein